MIARSPERAASIAAVREYEGMGQLIADVEVVVGEEVVCFR